MLGDIIILHKRIKGHDHMSAIPEIWCVTDVTFIFHFGLFFFLFTPLMTPKIKIKKNEKKKIWRYHTCVSKIMITSYMAPEK